MDASVLLHRIEQLTPWQQKEAEDFVDFLNSQLREAELPGPFRCDWAGALARYKDQFTSVELQKKATEWRLDF